MRAPVNPRRSGYSTRMIIGLASPRVATSLDDGLERVQRLMADAAARGAEIVCFPEAYLPGLRGQDFDVLPFDRGGAGARAPRRRRSGRATYAIADDPRDGAAHGGGPADRRRSSSTRAARCRATRPRTSSIRAKTASTCPGTRGSSSRSTGVKFGVAICHEGWRYPETVRWAAVRGARIVFHPQLTGSDRDGVAPDAVGRRRAAPYYEKAMMMPQPREHDLLRQRQLRPALPGIGDEPHRSVGRVPGATCPMARRACSCRRSTSRRRPGCCSPRGTLPSVIATAEASPAERDDRAGGS